MKLAPSAAAILLPMLVFAQETEPPAALVAAKPRARTAASLAAQTVIVFNENDVESVALAGFYQEKRGIPAANLIGVKCAREEEISREDYDRTIAEPLRKKFEQRGWWKLRKDADTSGRVEETTIRFLAVMRGIPLKISATGAYAGDDPEAGPSEVFTRSEAALDSDLAVLGLWSRRISGVLINPYFRDDKVIQDTELTSQLCVGRLDGPTPAIVRRMIEDSIAAEEKGLRGFAYVDARGLTTGALAEGDKWLLRAADDARQIGLPVVLDNGPALFPKPYPMRHAALYLGWYSEDAAGPMTRRDFRFEPGAVAVHLHSFSAQTLRGTDKGWCAPLLEAGAAATLGNVFEPYLGLTSNLDVFSQRLREGFTLAEASAMSQRFLSWMTTCVGDPIYRPFLFAAAGKTDAANEWDAYRDGVRVWLSKGNAAGQAALSDAAKRLKSGIIFEGLGLLQVAGNAPAAAIPSFEQARALHRNGDDRVRTAIHEASAIRAAKSAAEAAAFIKRQIAANSASDAAEVLRFLEPPPEKTAPVPPRRKP